MKKEVNLFWFRNDLRLTDNVGLSKATSRTEKCIAVFIFTEDLLDQLRHSSSERRNFFYQTLSDLNEELLQHGSRLLTFMKEPIEVFSSLSSEYCIKGIYCNSIYEPLKLQQDRLIGEFLENLSIPFFTYKDDVIFEADQVLKNDGSPYSVYSAYAKKWKSILTPDDVDCFKINILNFMSFDNQPIIHHDLLGIVVKPTGHKAAKLEQGVILTYDKFRDYPFIEGTSNIGMGLSLGTLSIRKCVRFALENNQTWLSQLIWRDFFKQILSHHPRVIKMAFKPAYERIVWRNDLHEFKAWCEGKTGYPFVDAGMTQLNKTGRIHNRVRMVVASFLCKHLLIDYKWGEAYFASKLNDYDLALNNGNWQWAAGCGCDAVPYFRIFNPTMQQAKFDKEGLYVKKWLPNVGEKNYPKPIVEHTYARERALQVYKQALAKN